RYCCRICSITAGSRSSPAMTSAGSPGNSCCSEKISTDTKNSVGISWKMRRTRKFSMTRVVRPTIRSLQLQTDYAHQPVGHLLVAFELVGMRNQQPAVIKIDDRQIVEQNLGQLLVNRLALSGIVDQPGILQRLVGLGVGIAAIVLWRPGVHEDIGIAVR